MFKTVVEIMLKLASISNLRYCNITWPARTHPGQSRSILYIKLSDEISHQVQIRWESFTPRIGGIRGVQVKRVSKNRYLLNSSQDPICVLLIFFLIMKPQKPIHTIQEKKSSYVTSRTGFMTFKCP